jgi:RHS repeat-associated protein
MARVWASYGSSRTTDTITFWSLNGQKLGDYALTTVSGTSYTPQFYATETSVNYYFGGRLLKNNNGWVYSDRLRSIGKFFPYGQERPSATTNGTEKFTGYFRDSETGNDYVDQRYYVPGNGRFITSDRGMGGAKAADPGSWNKYAYVSGDPVNRRDPKGLCSETDNAFWDDDDAGETFLFSGDCSANPGWWQFLGPYQGSYIAYNDELHLVSPGIQIAVTPCTPPMTWDNLIGQCDSPLSVYAQQFFMQVAADNPDGLINAAGLVMGIVALGPGAGTLVLDAYLGGVTLLTARNRRPYQLDSPRWYDRSQRSEHDKFRMRGARHVGTRGGGDLPY